MTRHRVLTALLVVHVPALVLAGAPAAAVLAAVALAAVGAGVGRTSRVARSVAVSAGLAVASVTLLWLAGEAAIGHLHVALVLAVVAAYRDRVAVLTAAGITAASYVAWIATASAAGASLPGLLAPPALVAAVGAASVACWTAARRAEDRARALSRHLRQHEGTLVRQVEDVEALKRQLIASVSHEFRTPLTSLTGYARTLAARMDELPPAAVDRCVSGIDQHATRLARLVHNLLAADGDIAADPASVTALAVVARRVTDEALAMHGRRVDVVLEVPVPLRARVELRLARQILGNLLDNAVRYAPEGSLVRVRGAAADGTVTVEVSNEAHDLAPGDLDRLFEPFAQTGPAPVEEGLHLGLHVARRAALACGGSLDATLIDGCLVLRLALPAQATAPVPARTASDVA